jgi:hypothetical protein
MIRDIGMAAGTVVGCIMVILAWLGINLLGVGLHSYGFTDSMFNGFISYLVFEIAFLAVTLGLIQFRNKEPKEPEAPVQTEDPEPIHSPPGNL